MRTRGPVPGQGYPGDRARVLTRLTNNSGTRVLTALSRVPDDGTLTTTAELAATTGLSRSAIVSTLARAAYCNLTERVQRFRWVGYRLTQAGRIHVRTHEGNLMLKALLRTGNRSIILMGLDRESVDRLTDGQPIRFDGNSVGVPGRTIALMFGETADDMVAEMAATGATDLLMNIPADTTPVTRPGGHTAEPIDVRRIVLDVVDDSDIAKSLYLSDPAMKAGIEITIGVMGRTAATLLATNRHTRGEVENIIRDIVVDLSFGGEGGSLGTEGPENLDTIAAANTHLYGQANAGKIGAVLAVMDPTFEDPKDPTGLTGPGFSALTSALAAAGYEIVDGPELLSAE